MSSQLRPKRLNRLPDELRTELFAARSKRGWSQAELGKRVGLPQTHISGIETGKIVPRYDTLLDLVRILDRDLIVVPRTLVPVVRALIRDHQNPGRGLEGDERPLYAIQEDEIEPPDEV
jgi:transcriptional regulator with XRE-family HTH domain